MKYFKTNINLPQTIFWILMNGLNAYTYSYVEQNLGIYSFDYLLFSFD